MTELPEGAEVRVYHYRPAENAISTLMWTRHEFKRRGTKPAPKGGLTEVTIKLPDGQIFVGQAHCSKRDNFSRKKGRLIATGRALAQVSP